MPTYVNVQVTVNIRVNNYKFDFSSLLATFFRFSHLAVFIYSLF